VLHNEFLFTISHYKITMNHVYMRLNWLIVVDGEISSSFLLDDDKGNKTVAVAVAVAVAVVAVVVVERCFIWQRTTALNYVHFCNPNESRRVQL
jgi:hypothetical protein